MQRVVTLREGGKGWRYKGCRPCIDQAVAEAAYNRRAGAEAAHNDERNLGRDGGQRCPPGAGGSHPRIIVGALPRAPRSPNGLRPLNAQVNGEWSTGLGTQRNHGTKAKSNEKDASAPKEENQKQRTGTGNKWTMQCPQPS